MEDVLLFLRIDLCPSLPGTATQPANRCATSRTSLSSWLLLTLDPLHALIQNALSASPTQSPSLLTLGLSSTYDAYALTILLSLPLLSLLMVHLLLALLKSGPVSLTPSVTSFQCPLVLLTLSS